MKRILSTILIFAMMLSVMPIMSMAEETEAIYADAVGEIPENLFKDPANSSLWYTYPTYVNSTTVQTKNEWKGNSFAGYGFRTTGEVKANTGWQVAAGSRLLPAQFNDYTAATGENYVIKFAVRTLTEGVGFGVRIGTWNGAYSGTSADVSQILGYEGGIVPVEGDGEWHLIKGTLPALRTGDINGGKVRQIVVGMAIGTPADVTMELNNHYAAIPEGEPYFAKEAVVEVNLEADAEVAEAGDTINLTAEVLNQLGETGALDQEAINWYVTNEARTEKIAIDGAFTFTDGALTIGAAAPAGNYYVVAESSVNADVRKGVALSILEPVKNDYIPGEEVDGQAYDITLTRTSEEREYYTSLNKLTLKAALVDADESTEGIAQNISWIVLDNEKRNEVSEGFDIAAENGEATVTFDAALPEDTYYIRAYKTGDIMFGRNFEVVIDNNQIKVDIIKELNDPEEEKLIDNLPMYLPYIDAQNVLYEKTDKEVLDAVIKAMAANGEEFTEENLPVNFTTACVLALYNAPSADVVLNEEDGSFNYEGELGLDTIDVDDVNLYEQIYAEAINDEGKALVLSAVKKAKTKAEFIEIFCEETLLKALSNSVYNGTAFVEEILTAANLAKVGVDADEYLDSDDKEEYAEDIAHEVLTLEELEDILTEERGSSGGGSGGGYGGGGGSSSKKPSEPEVKGPTVAIETGKDEVKENVAFADLTESHWAYANIQFLAKLGVFSGDDMGNFNPDKAVKREEFVKILVEAFDLAGTTNTAFSDVAGGAWYENYIGIAVANGIINGKGDGSFGIGQVVTREDMCVMIARVLGMGEGTDTTVTFTDTDAIAPYAQDSVGYLSLLGMVNGMPDGSFQPKVSCTRAQVARVISDIINYNVMEVNGK